MSDALHIVCPHCLKTNRLPAARLSQGGKCGQCKQPLFTGSPLELDGAGFQAVVGRTDIPVVVDFWAPWCGPCKAFAPIFERAAAALEPAVRLVKVNTEQVPTLAQQHGVRSIPTLAIFKHGREVARQAGALDQRSFEQWVKSNL